MTSRQKTVLRRWIISVVVLSRLFFWLVEFLPATFSDLFVNRVWLDMQISISSRAVPITITHQFIDPLLLGLIVYLVGRLCLISSKFGRVLVVLLAPITLVYLAYIFFYLVEGSLFATFALRQLPILGDLFFVVAVAAATLTALRFMIKGAVHFFKEDRQKNTS